MSTKELPPNDWRRTVYGRTTITGAGSRQSPRKADRDRVTAKQDGRCLYCDLPIGVDIQRGNKVISLRPHWDHFIPYSYSLRNPTTNWVLACHVCNGIKLARMFTSVQDARGFILPERIRKGYEEPDSVLHRMRLRITVDIDIEFERGVRRPTERQLELLTLAAGGMGPSEIARKLGMDPSGASHIIADAARNLRVEGREQAIQAAIDYGLIPDPSDKP